ncbi:hypothetical protein AN189_07450 [Loktanella sp. 3ANDIMAR09]|uniref:hypothetical protein n=1 Tax=Loktanella sp. 3ANDIMAR09 TaxID=1225657 RepID=UPI0006F40D4E|nr:hypothetical protein [Loktanella sp. 3ANDIMAR09]KQI68725.1 hypothetical protein AN189_07450 [Loktanella sp. 3ANDIMAR09]
MTYRPKTFRDETARQQWLAKQRRSPDGLGPAPDADFRALLDANTEQRVLETKALHAVRDLRQAASAAIEAMDKAHPNSDATALVRSIRDQIDTLFMSGRRAVSREPRE